MKIIKIEQLQLVFTLIIALCIISPPLANLLEVILFFGLFFCGAAHDNLMRYVKTLDFKIHVSFIFILSMGAFYPLVDTETYSSSILNWRKFLLLPIGIILFYDSHSQKQKTLNTILFLILALTIINLIYKSNSVFFFNRDVIRYEIGTTSSEGMFVSAALAIVLSSIVSKTKQIKIIEIAAVIFLVAYIALFTTGRSGYLAMLVVLIFMAIKYIKVNKFHATLKSWSLIVIVAISAVILLMSSKTSSDRIDMAIVELQHSEKNANENVVTSIGQRVIFWKNTIEMIPKYFLLGAGTGGFKAAYTEQVADKTGLVGAITQDPHNQYLKILIEQGILGLILFIAMIVRTFIDTKLDNENYLLGPAVIFIWILTSCFNAHFTTFMEGTFIWSWMGLMNRYTSNK
jgi:O-antigen ligase